MRTHALFCVCLFIFVLSLTAKSNDVSLESNVWGEDVIEIQIAVILPKDTDTPPEIRHYPYRFEMACPAIDIAVEKLMMAEHFFGGRNVTMTIRKVDSGCSNAVAAIRAVEFITEKQVDVFLGPACDYAAVAVARFAAHWAIPFLTTGAKAKEFAKKDIADFRTLTRAHGPFLKMAEFMMEILRTFEWSRTAIIHSDKDVSPYRDCWLFGGALFHLFQGAGWYDPGKGYPGYQKFEEDLNPNYRQILQEIVMPHGRIVVMCASGAAVRKIMLAAHDLGMTKINKKTGRAEYAFFNIQLFDSAYFGDIGWKNGTEGDARDEDAKEAYRSLMTLTLRKPDTKEYQDFAREVKQRALEDYGFDYDKEGEDVNSFVGAFHDAVILYALALNETLEEGGTPRDGHTITHKMWNRTFEGISGDVRIDDNGDRDADYSLLEMTDIENGTFSVIANYYGTRKVFEPVEGVKIDWPGETPPDDVPECGFEGELCIDTEAVPGRAPQIHCKCDPPCRLFGDTCRTRGQCYNRIGASGQLIQGCLSPGKARKLCDGNRPMLDFFCCAEDMCNDLKWTTLF